MDDQNRAQIYPWEDDFTNQDTETTTQTIGNQGSPTDSYPWEDDFPPQDGSSQSTGIPGGISGNPTDLYPWEDEQSTLQTGTTTKSPTISDLKPTNPNGVYPWEDGYGSNGPPQATTKPTWRPSPTSPVTTFWGEETTTIPPQLTSTRKTTSNGLIYEPIFQTPTELQNYPIQYQDPCRNMGIFRQIICLGRYLNPSIGFSLNSGFGG